MITARKFIVTGRVQGVGFRYFACQAAARHGIAGTVRNLSDGSVEAIAEGLPAAVDAFRHELELGPRYGRVDQVVELPVEATGRTSFDAIS
ncbi:MAG: acylphosphatase [Blastocatellia bacterium]|nr:acylphosphatase [Blastocatellia bacterium]MBK6425003.1 acylphosphatase [Blastocatellia bacterium]